MFLKIITAILTLLNKAADIWRQKQQLDAGQAQQEAANAKETLDAIAKANEARDRTRRDDSGAASTNELPDDGFRRD